MHSQVDKEADMVMATLMSSFSNRPNFRLCVFSGGAVRQVQRQGLEHMTRLHFPCTASLTGGAAALLGMEPLGWGSVLCSPRTQTLPL